MDAWGVDGIPIVHPNSPVHVNISFVVESVVYAYSCAYGQCRRRMRELHSLVDILRVFGKRKTRASQRFYRIFLFCGPVLAD